jgi:hypothetical protein
MSTSILIVTEWGLDEHSAQPRLRSVGPLILRAWSGRDHGLTVILAEVDEPDPQDDQGHCWTEIVKNVIRTCMIDNAGAVRAADIETVLGVWVVGAEVGKYVHGPRLESDLRAEARAGIDQENERKEREQLRVLFERHPDYALLLARSKS